MTIEEKALEFAITAHKGQVRKSEPDKPMIFHPINVGNILKEYGFDSNVIAAGYLHDVVEDTKHTFDDIKNESNSNYFYELVLEDSKNELKENIYEALDKLSALDEYRYMDE